MREFNDKLAWRDVNNLGGAKANHGLWAKTEVIMGYGDVHNNPTGKSSLDEVIFAGSNTVTIGGVQYAFEKIFGVSGKQNLDILSRSLYNTLSCDGNPTPLEIGYENSPEIKWNEEHGKFKTYLPTGGSLTLTPEEYKAFMTYVGETYQVPRTAESKDIGNVVYRPGHRVQLFGIGTTGITDNDVTVYPVNYKDTGIEMSSSYDGTNKLLGHMLPFRQTADTLSESERLMYFGKKTDTIGTAKFTSYYLKKFEQEPVIKHVWASGAEADYDETVNQESARQEDIWNDDGQKTNTLESFTEMLLKISAKDLKEYYLHLEQEDTARFNTIALFSGRYVRDDNPNDENGNPKTTIDYGDFEDVMLFSKLIIPVEYVSLNKDLNIIYRVYGS